ncbi:hypothetical protein CMV_019807 [Castanea mollissima]|uniref:Uncharacterized protein n=1 Tax=Castanea mollissima TaxID=60419 RepID=A0A8J4QNM9_9ROSI|nr:hypothetical protein CMV_019807 [Castanea mollissima]
MNCLQSDKAAEKDLGVKERSRKIERPLSILIARRNTYWFELVQHDEPHTTISPVKNGSLAFLITLLHSQTLLQERSRKIERSLSILIARSNTGLN